MRRLLPSDASVEAPRHEPASLLGVTPELLDGAPLDPPPLDAAPLDVPPAPDEEPPP
jgi:hypothetical protein